MSGLFLDHIQKSGPSTRLEKAVHSQAKAYVRGEIAKGRLTVGQSIEVNGVLGIVQADGGITPYTPVRQGFSGPGTAIKEDITKGRRRDTSAYKPGDSRSAEGMAKAKRYLGADKNKNSRL